MNMKNVGIAAQSRPPRFELKLSSFPDPTPATKVKGTVVGSGNRWAGAAMGGKMFENFGMVRGEFRIEERDIQILLGLEKWGVMGLGQLDGMLFRKGIGEEERTRLFFNEIERKDYWLGAYKRLRRLELGGLIRAELYVNQRKVLFLTDRGHRTLREIGRARLKRNLRTLSEFWVRHELIVGAVGLVISEVLGLAVTSERERFQLGKFDREDMRAGLIMPDLVIPTQVQPKALEIELEPKSKKRYEKLWCGYRARLPEDAALLYLTGWPRGDQWIIELAYKLGWDFIYAAPLSEFRESLGRRGFASRKQSGSCEVLSLTRPKLERPNEDERRRADVSGPMLSPQLGPWDTGLVRPNP